MGNGLREQGRRTGKENEEENGEGERGERTWIHGPKNFGSFRDIEGNVTKL